MRTIDYISYQQKSLLPYPASCLENSGRDNLRSNHDTGSIVRLCIRRGNDFT